MVSCQERTRHHVGLLMNKYTEGQRELQCVFMDIEKAYDSMRVVGHAVGVTEVGVHQGSTLCPFLLDDGQTDR